MAGYPFNVRVYGLLLDEGVGKILLSEERIQGKRVVKFPGGGLRSGEGPKDCVIREFREELDIEVSVLAHFYTTDFFQPSAFDPEEQVISIYYRVAADPLPGTLNRRENAENFFWEDLNRIGPERFELPIDREVGKMLRDEATARGSSLH